MAPSSPLLPPHTCLCGKHQPLITTLRHIAQPLGQPLRWQVAGIRLPVGLQALLQTIRDASLAPTAVASPRRLQDGKVWI